MSHDYDDFCHCSTSYHRRGALCRRSVLCPLIVVVIKAYRISRGQKPPAFFYACAVRLGTFAIMWRTHLLTLSVSS
jgi:hypothetical protein